MKKSKLSLSIIITILMLLSACRSTPISVTGIGESVITSDSGLDQAISAEEKTSTSGPDLQDYEIAFPQDAVNEITVTISPENWQKMMDDMAELYGELGSRPQVRTGPPGPPPGADGGPPFPAGEEQKRPPGEGMPGQAGGGMMGGDDDQNPVWVEADISFAGEIWEHVGIRFKGNSSLRSTWGNGSLKLPFKLDFDEYEDQYPTTEDQRFYGFKQLSFSSGFRDDSLLREKIAADLFREAGVPSAQTAFYSVSIDYGDGPIYFGLYTAVEVVDDTVIETQFSDDNGNVYKPEGIGATFTAGSFNEDGFDKETNQDEDDYSDILALFTALHADNRISDPESWRAELEGVFDVDSFLNWLAVNTVIQNWDTYGVMHHNYYLYNNPESNLLVWIPWDNNGALKSSGGIANPIKLDLSDVTDDWPLISYMRDDPVYYQQYLGHLNAILDEFFGLENMAKTCQYYHDLITPYVLSEGEEFTQVSSLQAFERSVKELIQHTRERIEAAETFLSSP